MKREVRQRCGFGCVLCGDPIYEYHHMTPYAEVECHEADNLTLLCDAHHKQATNGLLTSDQVRRADSDPVNIKRGASQPFGLNLEGSHFSVSIGGNRCIATRRPDRPINPAIALSVDDCDLVAFGVDIDGNVYLHATIFDAANLPALLIRENELVYSTGSWDIEFSGQILTLREAARQIMFEVKFEPPSSISIARARLMCNGVDVIVRPDHVFVVNSELLVRGCVADNCTIAIQLGRNTRRLPAAYSCSPELLQRNYLARGAAESLARKSIEKLDEMTDAANRDLDPGAGAEPGGTEA